MPMPDPTLDALRRYDLAIVAVGSGTEFGVAATGELVEGAMVERGEHTWLMTPIAGIARCHDAPHSFRDSCHRTSKSATIPLASASAEP